jgi:hypothetical protein
MLFVLLQKNEPVSVTEFLNKIGARLRRIQSLTQLTEIEEEIDSIVPGKRIIGSEANEESISTFNVISNLDEDLNVSGKSETEETIDAKKDWKWKCKHPGCWAVMTTRKFYKQHMEMHAVKYFPFICLTCSGKTT